MASLARSGRVRHHPRPSLRRTPAHSSNAKTRAFDIERRNEERIRGAALAMLDAIERGRDEDEIRARADEIARLASSAPTAYARDARVYGTWRMVWSAQDRTANAFQRVLSGLAVNYQIIAPSVVTNVAKFGWFEVEARATSEVLSDSKIAVVIREVDVKAFGAVVKTIALTPKPGAGEGWVEQMYVDDEFRVSVGNKGSLFCHVKEKGKEMKSLEAATATAVAATASSTALARVADDEENVVP